MSIETDIQQSKPFGSEWIKGIINLIYTYNWMMERHCELLKPYGITQQQFNVLRILRGAHPKPLDPNSIRERMIDKKSDISRLMQRLELKELAERRVSSKDARLVDLFILPKGLEVLSKIDLIIPDIEGIMKGLNASEIVVLNELLEKLRTNYQSPKH